MKKSKASSIQPRKAAITVRFWSPVSPMRVLPGSPPICGETVDHEGAVRQRRNPVPKRPRAHEFESERADFVSDVALFSRQAGLVAIKSPAWAFRLEGICALGMIIAIDGPAASGKGTIARRLAVRYGLPHLDTGLLYRATAAALIAADRDLYDEGAAVAAARGLGLMDFDETVLRTRQMGEAASVVAAMPGVRAALIETQRAFATRPEGAVLDGRDIGTIDMSAGDRKDLCHCERRSTRPAEGARTRTARRAGGLSIHTCRYSQAGRPRFKPVGGATETGARCKATRYNSSWDRGRRRQSGAHR